MIRTIYYARMRAAPTPEALRAEVLALGEDLAPLLFSLLTTDVWRKQDAETLRERCSKAARYTLRHPRRTEPFKSRQAKLAANWVLLSASIED